jgi:undecaprenyl-diphosphatase
MNISIFNFFFSLSSNPIIASWALLVSNIFIYIFGVFAIVVVYIIKRDIFYPFIILGTSAVAWVFAYIIKNITMISRPFVALGITPLFFESGFSFPSLHVIVISSISTIMWSIDYRLGIIFFIFTILVAISRMIIGVHYPIDVVCGLIFGVLIGLFILWFYKATFGFAFLRKYI